MEKNPPNRVKEEDLGEPCKGRTIRGFTYEISAPLAIKG